MYPHISSSEDKLQPRIHAALQILLVRPNYTLLFSPRRYDTSAHTMLHLLFGAPRFHEDSGVNPTEVLSCRREKWKPDRHSAPHREGVLPPSLLTTLPALYLLLL
ncbi:hypothetical protein E2C01_055208 [Portunus trituberculatus]|uniref:Uncharacterized protein n=1 Tax=Portunus trituberculatus TaxID=210409 RepID=A0A5B7GX12_PORTR|nr:hypothetical protein [Portunus trituberculatus]